MAFRTDAETKETAFERALRVAKRLKTLCTNNKSAMAAGTYNADQLVALRDDLINADAEFVTAASVPGILQYAKDVEDDQDYNIATEFTAMRNAVQAAKATIDSLAPTSGGYLALWTFPTGSGLTPRTFTSGQTSTLQTNLQSIIDSIA